MCSQPNPIWTAKAAAETAEYKGAKSYEKQPKTMSDAFSMVMAIVSIFSAVFILVLVASFAWVCVRALSIEDSLTDYYDNDSKLMREPLIDHIYAQEAKVSDIEISTCVWKFVCCIYTINNTSISSTMGPKPFVIGISKNDFRIALAPILCR